MDKSTEWYISGAIWLCAAFAIFLLDIVISSRAADNAFWFGSYGLSPVAEALLALGPYLIIAGILLGIVFLLVGLSKSGVLIVTTAEPALAVQPSTTSTRIKRRTERVSQKETIIKEYIMTKCDRCESLIPQTSIFCPDCGIKRKQ